MPVGEGPFFHGSGQPLATGLVLRQQPGSFVRRRKLSIMETELILEAVRPEGCLSRRASVFMTDDPMPQAIKDCGGLVERIYEVAPQGRVERNHLGWWTLVNQACISGPPTDRGQAMDWARAYWSGEDCPAEINRLGKGWEFRARRAEVVALVSWRDPASDTHHAPPGPECPVPEPEDPAGDLGFP